MMKIVVGLGNPGEKYQGTRHNIGFDLITELARRGAAERAKLRFEADCTEIMLGSERVLLVAPQTFMNLSGRSVQQAVKFFQLPVESILVVCDDMNLNVGQLRLRAGGSAGGQKGLQNILQSLGTEQVPRLRIGVGRPPANVDAANYVLGKFRKDERPQMDDAVLRAADGVADWIESGLELAMNRVNRSDSATPE